MRAKAPESKAIEKQKYTVLASHNRGLLIDSDLAHARTSARAPKSVLSLEKVEAQKLGRLFVTFSASSKLH